MPRQKPAPPARATSSAVRTFRRILGWMLGLVLFTATAGALGIAVYPAVTSGAAMAVLSGSMTPSYPVGAMVFTRPVDPADVAVGDVITFRRPSNPAELVTHRVIAVDDASGSPVFTTKGDANDATDLDPVAADLVQGRLWFGVPQLGRAAAILHSPQGLGFLVLLVCAVVAVAPGKRPEQDGSADDDRRGVEEPIAPADVDRTCSMPLVAATSANSSVPARPLRLPPVPPPAPRRPGAGTSALPSEAAAGRSFTRSGSGSTLDAG